MTATHGFSSGLLGLRTRSALSGGRRIGLLGMVGSLGGGLPWIRRRGLDSRAWLSRSCDLELLLAAVALENSRSRGSARIIGLGGAGLDWGCGASQVWVKSSRKLYDWSGSPDVNKSLRGDNPGARLADRDEAGILHDASNRVCLVPGGKHIQLLLLQLQNADHPETTGVVHVGEELAITTHCRP